MTPPVLNRRRFLTYSGVGAVALAGAGLGIDELVTAARTDPLPPGAGVLVLLTMYGGNDGLSTVVPAADPAYQAARPALAYREDEVLPLGDGLGLNPGMPGLKGLWDDRRLSIVRGVSYPKPDHSHFRSMDIWQTASPEHPASTGWLGRWLDANGRDPLHAVSIGPVLPPLLAGATTAGAALPTGGVKLPRGALGKAFAALGAPSAGDSPAEAVAAKAITDVHRCATALGPALSESSDPAAMNDGKPTGGGKAKGRAGGLAHELDVVARCVELGAPARVYAVSVGGFDTHAGERVTQQRLLTEVDRAVTGFVNRMSTAPNGHNVVLAAYSEFGRRVAANANQGTDHGTAGPMFVAGATVRGGFVGDQPSLTDLDDGDLKVTTDFRDVYATLLADVVKSDPEPVLGARRAHLPLISA